MRVKAPPAEGEANRALVRLLGRVLEVPASSVRILRGAASRDKLVRIEGLSAADVASRLAT